MRDSVIFFNTTITAGSELTLVPDTAVRFDDNEIKALNILQIGWCSIIADPFGAIVFSLDQTTWVKALSHVFPATIYAKPTEAEPIIDVKCRADIEIVVWRGTNGMIINEEGLVELTENIPAGSTVGGAEYYVY
jgi:hypothetical protein